MDRADLEQAILAHVRQPGYQPVKPRVIAKKLQIPEVDGPEIRKTVKRLVARGLLSWGPGHLVKTADGKAARGNRIVGVFRRMEAGHGFVRPSGSSPADARSLDIYIPARKTRDASTGDTVMVQLLKPGRHHPGTRGEIVEIVARETRRFVGTYYYELGGQSVVAVDGRDFSRPIPVGDPGAKGARPNDKVVFEMIRFPTHLDDGEGVILEVLGQRGQPGVDTISVIHQFNLPQEFPGAALADARQQADLFREEIPAGRLDLTGETIVTIDPADARDFDDAISLTRLDNGHWRLGVHIADVAHFVPIKTGLDREAQNRATSVYLPDRVIPMLPEIISNALASLQPGKIRYTKTAFLEFTPEGVRTHSEFHNSVIRSSRRLAYEEVDDFLANREPFREKWGEAVHSLLGRMHELAMTLRRRRYERGALELTMPEVKVELDENGRVSGAKIVEHTESHQIIEEFMLAANEAVAEYLQANSLFFLRRVHEAPDPRKLQSLTSFVAELGYQTDSLESRFEIQKLLRQVVGEPEAYAVNYAVLRSMQRAVYSPAEEGHYALASECYCHFTSPIRRYPDLTVHRLLGSLLAGTKPRNDYDELVLLAEHCSDREQRAEAAERDLTKLKLLAYMADRIGEEMDAVITGVESFGLFVQGLGIPAEGLIHVSTLDDDDYRFDRTAHTLAGFRSGNQFRLGDVVRVAVAHVDVDRRELDFRLVRRERPAKVKRESVHKKRSPKAPDARNKPRTKRKRR